jgi:predicted TIM-barrel fold metal-dependent hydrolase
MTIDSHLHVGDFPMFGVHLDPAYPDAKIILGHMDHGNIVYINAAIDIAARHPVKRVGDRVLYGSDAPFHDPAVEMLKVRVSGLGEAAVRAVLHDNAERLFFG